MSGRLGAIVVAPLSVVAEDAQQITVLEPKGEAEGLDLYEADFLTE